MSLKSFLFFILLSSVFALDLSKFGQDPHSLKAHKVAAQALLRHGLTHSLIPENLKKQLFSQIDQIQSDVASNDIGLEVICEPKPPHHVEFRKRRAEQDKVLFEDLFVTSDSLSLKFSPPEHELVLVVKHKQCEEADGPDLEITSTYTLEFYKSNVELKIDSADDSLSVTMTGLNLKKFYYLQSGWVKKITDVKFFSATGVEFHFKSNAYLHVALNRFGLDYRYTLGTETPDVILVATDPRDSTPQIVKKTFEDLGFNLAIPNLWTQKKAHVYITPTKIIILSTEYIKAIVSERHLKLGGMSIDTVGGKVTLISSKIVTRKNPRFIMEMRTALQSATLATAVMLPEGRTPSFTSNSPILEILAGLFKSAKLKGFGGLCEKVKMAATVTRSYHQSIIGYQSPSHYRFRSDFSIKFDYVDKTEVGRLTHHYVSGEAQFSGLDFCMPAASLPAFNPLLPNQFCAGEKIIKTHNILVHAKKFGFDTDTKEIFADIDIGLRSRDVVDPHTIRITQKKSVVKVTRPNIILDKAIITAGMCQAALALTVPNVQLLDADSEVPKVSLTNIDINKLLLFDRSKTEFTLVELEDHGTPMIGGLFVKKTTDTGKVRKIDLKFTVLQLSNFIMRNNGKKITVERPLGQRVISTDFSVTTQDDSPADDEYVDEIFTVKDLSLSGTIQYNLDNNAFIGKNVLLEGDSPSASFGKKAWGESLDREEEHMTEKEIFKILELKVGSVVFIPGVKLIGDFDVKIKCFVEFYSQILTKQTTVRIINGLNSVSVSLPFSKLGATTLLGLWKTLGADVNFEYRRLRGGEGFEPFPCTEVSSQLTYLSYLVPTAATTLCDGLENFIKTHFPKPLAVSADTINEIMIESEVESMTPRELARIPIYGFMNPHG